MREFRPALPKVPGAFGVNEAGSHQREGTGFARYGVTPVALGRSKPAPLPERTAPPTVGVTGKPLWRVQIPPACQPPTMPFRIGFETSTRRPLPTGRS